METFPVMLPRENLHAPETLPGWWGVFRWTEETARLRPANPGGTVVARLILGAGPGRTVPLLLQTDTSRFRFVVHAAPRTYHLLLPPASGQRLHLSLTAPTIQEDGRSLGVMVGNLRVSGGGTPPSSVVLALLAATFAAVVLGERISATQLFWKASIILLLQVIVLLWQIAGGWQYALFVPALWLFAFASLLATFLDRHMPGSLQPASHDVDQPTSRQPVPRRVLLLLLLLALLVRLPWLAAPDPVGDMELAARRMGFLHTEGLAGAYIYDGDYMPLRLYLLAGLSKLNVLSGGDFHDPLPAATKTLIKLPGLLADLATLVVMVYFLHAKSGNQGGISGTMQRKRFTIPLLYALSPPVWMNVAWWGQVDALLLLPLLLMVLVLDRSDGRWSWFCWIVAFLIKPQAIIFAPLLYFATLRLHGARGFIQGATISTGVFSLGSLPLVLAGQGPGLAQAYFGSVGRFPKLNIGAYNLWYLLTGGASGDDQQLLLGLLSYRTIGLLLMAGAALLVAASLLRRADQQTRLLSAGVLALSFFVLPTQIHERYLFLGLVFLALCIGYHHLFVLPYSILVFSALLNILGTLDGFVPLATPFIAASPLPFLCALANILVLIALFVVLLQQVQNTGSTLRHQPVCTQSSRPEQA